MTRCSACKRKDAVDGIDDRQWNLSPFQGLCEDCIAIGRTGDGHSNGAVASSQSMGSQTALRAEATSFVPGAVYGGLTTEGCLLNNISSSNLKVSGAKAVVENRLKCSSGSVVAAPSLSLPPAKLFACLVDGCDRLFGKWGHAVEHMKKECKYEGPKPNMKCSKVKAEAIASSNAPPIISSIPMIRDERCHARQGIERNSDIVPKRRMRFA